MSYKQLGCVSVYTPLVQWGRANWRRISGYQTIKYNNVVGDDLVSTLRPLSYRYSIDDKCSDELHP